VFGQTLGVPVYGVGTLDVIARAAVPAAAGREFLAATDARRKEVYWARYSAAGARLTGPEVSRPDEVPDGPSMPVAGPAVALYPEAFGEPIWREHPSAVVLAELVAGRLAALAAGGPGRPDAAAELLPPEPLYLRRPDARVPGPPKRVTAP
jgi:tRNA threonylcarbamoyladenosine biosynthesis protein TsaB